MCDFFTRIDFLGHAIHMNYKDQNAFQTNIGACMSLLIMIVVGSFGLLKTIRLVTHEQPEFIVNTVLKDMYVDYPEKLNAAENRFEFSVAFLSINPYKIVPNDPRITKINMRTVEMV